MTDEDTIHRLHEILGVGTMSGPRVSPSKLNNKPMFDYRVSGVKAYAVFVAILPWMSERRRTQIHTAIENWRIAPGHWSKSHPHDEITKALMSERRRRTHCKQNHELTPENSMSNGSGGRQCRICHNEYQRKRRLQIKI